MRVPPCTDGCGGVPDDEFDRQDHVLDLVVVETVDEQAARVMTDLVGGLADRGQRRLEPVHERDVVVTDHGHVARYGQAGVV
jgi:hypothetical protein